MLSSFSTLFIEFWPEIFLFDLLRYAIPASLLTALLAMLSKRLKHRRIQRRRPSLHDRHRELIHSLSTIVIFSFVGLAIVIGEPTGWIKVESSADSLIGFIIDLLLIIVLHDTYFYWTHRAMHHKTAFKRVHKTHHLSRTPQPWAAYSFSPLEAVVQAFFLPIYLLLFPTHVIVITVFLAHMIIRNVVAHAGVELFPRRWMSWPVLRLITTTCHHDMHHQYYYCNYGLYFTWWDRWMGTEHPDYQQRFEQLTQKKSAYDNISSRQSRSFLNNFLVVACALSLIPFYTTKVEAREECKLDGYWVTEGFGVIVQIESSDSPSRISATIRWVFDEQGQSLVGLNIFSGFKGSDCLWKKGLILNPDNNKKYRSSIRLDGRDRLLVKGCIGPFCQTRIWQPYRKVLESMPRVLEHH